MNIQEAYEKFATRFNVSKSDSYRALYLDVVPNKAEMIDLVIETFLWFAYEGDNKPAPKTFSSKFWELRHKKYQETEERGEIEKGCSKCSHGWVAYKYAKTNTKGERIWIRNMGKCAACHTEAYHFQYMLQMDDKIYMASRQIGKCSYVPDLNNIKLCYNLHPINSNALLEESFALGPVPFPKEWLDRIKDVKIRAVMEILASKPVANRDDCPF